MVIVLDDFIRQRELIIHESKCMRNPQGVTQEFEDAVEKTP